MILCILKGEMPFKMHKVFLFPEKKMCVPTLPKIFRPVNRNTLFFFIICTVLGPLLFVVIFCKNSLFALSQNSTNEYVH